MGSAVAAFSIIASQEMQNLVVEPFVFRAKSAQTLEWGWEDVALAGCVATALTSIAIVVVAVIFRCNKLAQQRETEKARFADKSASSKTSHEQAEMETTTRRPKVPKMSPALKPAKWRVAELSLAILFPELELHQQSPTAQAQQLDQTTSAPTTQGTPVVEKAQAMPVPKMQPRTPPLPPAATQRPKVTKPKEDKRKPTAAPVETPDVPASPTRVPLRLTSSSSAKNTTAKNQATVAKGPQVGATFNFQARRAFRCQ